MFFHQIRYGHVGDGGEFPGVVHLNFCHGFTPGFAGVFPDRRGDFAGADLGDGVIHQILFHAADIGVHPPFADGADVNAFRQKIHDFCPERYGIDISGFFFPRPVISDHPGGGIGPVHPFFHGGNHVGNDFFRRDLTAVGALVTGALVMAVGGIFRHGDAECPAQPRCIAEHRVHGVFQIIQRFPGAGGTVGFCQQIRLFQSCPVGLLFVKIQRHTTGFIQVKVNFDPVLCAAFHDFPEAGQAFFTPGRKFFRTLNRHQQIEQSVEPHSADAHGGILGKEIFRHRIKLIGIAQHISAAGGVRVDVVEFKPVIPGGGQGGKTVRKRKRLILIPQFFTAEVFCHDFPDAGSGGFFFLREFPVKNFFAFRLELTQFVPEKVFFLEGISHFFRCPVQ